VKKGFHTGQPLKKPSVLFKNNLIKSYLGAAFPENALS
jgi:hypothetical protein